jgi:phosphoserine phosphatase RsbU/P
MSAVAGDFYDFLCIDEKRVGILVADVSGHGVPAALIASMLKVAFAGQAAHAHDPARVLNGLNGSLCGNFEAHFVTAAYLFVDLEKSLLHYSAAAHPPLMIASGAPGNVREIEANGLMLGMFPEAVYSSVEIRVCPGDRCLLYTDGILEAKNAAQEEFGESRCKEFLETPSRHSCRSFRKRPSRKHRWFFRLQLHPRAGGRHYPPRPRLSAGLFVFKKTINLMRRGKN